MKNEPPVHVVHYRSPAFYVRIPEGSYPVVGGAIYLATATDAGRKLIGEYSLQDPSLRVRDRLLGALAAHLGVTIFDVIADDFRQDDLDALRMRFPSGLVLDFKTILWSLQHFLFESGHRFFDHVRARLLRMSDGKVLWQGYCQFQPGESANVEWEKLNADRGALLRATIEAAADACADRLRAQSLDGSRETVAR